jgi:hypothetical protein
MCIHTKYIDPSLGYVGFCTFSLSKYTYPNTHRGINVDHRVNVDQHLKPRNKCKYRIFVAPLAPL